MSRQTGSVADGWHFRVVQRPSLDRDDTYRSLKMVRYEGGKPVEVDGTLGFCALNCDADPVAEVARQLAYASKSLRRTKVIDISEIGA